VNILGNDETVKEGLQKINRTAAILSRNFDDPGYTFNEMNIRCTIVRNSGIIARDICEYNVISSTFHTQ